MIEITLTTEQKVRLTLHPNNKGTPVPIDGVPEWAIVEGESTVESDDDGMSAELVSANVPGITDYMVTADFDLTDGIDEVAEIVRVTVVSPTATNIGLSAGTPEAKV